MICLFRIEKIKNFVGKDESILEEMDYMVIVGLIIGGAVLFKVMMVLTVAVCAHCSMI